METISVTISTKETEVLLKTADFLRDLAGVEVVKTVDPVVEELSPQAEADAMEERMDAVIAGADTAPPTVDAAGSPWDARIHASSKAFVADGTWRLKRGVVPELVAQVKAELLQGEEPVVETVPAIETPSAVPLAAAPVETPPATASATPIPPAAPAAVTTYPELSALITEQVKANKLQPTDISDACKASGATAAVGASSFPDLAKIEAAPYILLVAEQLRLIWATRA